ALQPLLGELGGGCMLRRAGPGNRRERHDRDAVVAELGGIELAASGGVAVDDPAPALADHLPVPAERVAGDAVEGDVDPAFPSPAGHDSRGLGAPDLEDLLDVVLRVAVDDVVRALR